MKRLLFILIIIICSSSCKQISHQKKEYESVTIGSQVWMKYNLNEDHYRNGDTIPEVKDPNDWISLKTGAWCYYENSLKNGEIYGKLYNGYTVKDPRGLAPEGWHIPSFAEWLDLIRYLGGSKFAGGKLKETGTKYWLKPNEGATNVTGFSALPGGWRYTEDGGFYIIGQDVNFWSSSDGSENGLWQFHISYVGEWVGQGISDCNSGQHVRCIKD